MDTVKIGKKVVGRNNPVCIVAEIASAHQGNPETCKELVREVARAGADAVKFQKFSAEELVVSGPKQEHFKKIELADSEWREIISIARKSGLEVMADVFDEKSCDLMDELGVSAFKIHSTDLSNPYMLAHVAGKKKPVLLGVGGGKPEEIKEAIEIVKKNGCKDIMLVHGFQAYPTKLEDTNFGLISALKERFGLNVGYHDHVDAESDLALFMPCVSVAYGASLVEKHVILSRKEKGLDYQSALTPEEFKRLIKNIREFERAIGHGKFEFSDAEKKYREEVRKNIVARRDIPAGTVITLEMLAFKRSKPGLSPLEAPKVVGKKTKVKILKDEVISREKLT